jgi:hypothetical protein
MVIEARVWRDDDRDDDDQRALADLVEGRDDDDDPEAEGPAGDRGARVRRRLAWLLARARRRRG